MKHELPKLSYKYDALEPYIDAKTMEIHHIKHHQTYIDKLNDAIHKPEGMKFHDMQVDELLKNINSIPESIKPAIRNHGGGHANHSLFWQLMTPNVKDREAKGKVVEAIKKQFNSLEDFKKQFSDAATNRFGSGWAWLVLNNKKLEIISTSNQDSPLMENKIPLLGLDVWEHAYYLKYMNKRVDYVDNWWNVVNWKKVNELFEKNQ